MRGKISFILVVGSMAVAMTMGSAFAAKNQITVGDELPSGAVEDRGEVEVDVDDVASSPDLTHVHVVRVAEKEVAETAREAAREAAAEAAREAASEAAAGAGGAAGP